MTMAKIKPKDIKNNAQLYIIGDFAIKYKTNDKVTEKAKFVIKVLL